MPFSETRTQNKGSLTVIYSDPGFGKTGLAAGFLKELYERYGLKAVYGDLWEGGDITIPPGLPAIWWQPDTTQPPISEAMRLLHGLQGMECSGFAGDTISSMGEQFLNDTVAQDLSDKETKRVRVKSGGEEVPVPGLLDYKAAQTAFGQWMLECGKLLYQGKHVLLLAHERLLETTSDAGVVLKAVGGPEVVGSKLTRTLPKVPHVSARIYCKRVGGGIRRYLQTESDSLHICKDRLKVFPPSGVDITADLGNSPAEFEANIVAQGQKVFKMIFDKMDSLKEN